MLLFQKRFHAGLVDGSVTLTFRQWPKARVKAGGRYRVHPIGVVEVEEIRATTVGALTEDDARRSGFTGLAALKEYLAQVSDAPLSNRRPLWRIALHHAGDEDRVPLALNEELSDDEAAQLYERLAAWSPPRRWPFRTLRLIEQRPHTAASQLAPSLQLETLPFKEKVRRLKKLGLTQSFEVGYALSPRGRAFVAWCRLNRAGAFEGSASPSAKRPRSTGRPAPGRGRHAGGARGGRSARGSGRAGAASRGRR